MTLEERFNNQILAKQTKILQSFQSGYAAGIEFIDENGGGPDVRLRKRQRAKKSK